MSATAASNRILRRSSGVRPGSGTSLQDYSSIRGATWRDAARLYIGFGASAFQKIVTPRRYTCVGASLPGTDLLTVDAGGIRARVRPGTNDLDLLVHHEPKTRTWFRVKTGEVVIDVGAHIGLYTLLSAPMASKVVAFEPDPGNFRVLRENIALNGFANVDAVPGAVSRSSGWVELLPAVGANRGTSSVHVPGLDSPQPRSIDGWVAVRCDSLDAWLEPRALTRIDWLKVDVEGHETEVLAGASSTLAKARHLILEVTRDHADECLRMAEAAGLTLVGGEPGDPASNWFFVREEVHS